MKNKCKPNKPALKWLVGKSKGNFYKVWLLVLSNSFFSVLSVAFAWAVKIILDGASKGNGFSSQVLTGSIFIAVIVLLQFVFRFINNGLSEHVKGKLEMGYKSYLFGGVLKKKYQKITAYHSGEVLNRLSQDVSICSDGIATILPTAISAVVRLLVAVISLFFLDPSFAVIFIVAGASVAIVMGLLRGKLKSLHKDIQSSDGKVRSFMQEAIENLLSLKIFSAHNEINEKSSRLQNNNFKAKMKRKNYSVLGVAVYGFIYSAGYVLALIFGAIKIANGASGFSYGSLLAVLQLVNNVQIPFSSLSSVIPKYYSMIGSAERLIELDKIEEDPPLDSRAEEVYDKMQGIQIKDLSFVYDREVVFDKAGVFIPKGKFIVISGESGIGKSTLFKLLLGIHDYSGEINLVCKDTKESLSQEKAGLFSLLSQGGYTISGTIKENVTLFNDSYSDEQIERALRISLSDEFVYSFPQGLETVIGEKGLGLSEGQAQRLALARCILANRKILLLDEATSALDIATEEKVLKNLKKLDGVTIIMITHKEKALEICDNHLVVKDKKFEIIK